MLLFMSELNGDEWNEERGTEEWVNSIDRGGLWHVKDDTYQLFYLMEEDIRKYLLVSASKSFDETTKAGILASLFSNEDLLFHSIGIQFGRQHCHAYIKGNCRIICNS